MSNLVKSVALSGDSTHTDALDEFHRKQFRKTSTEDAIATLRLLGELDDGQPHSAHSIGHSFWIWETLEEAIIGKIDEMEKDDFEKCFSAFVSNTKGSSHLID